MRLAYNWSTWLLLTRGLIVLAMKGRFFQAARPILLYELTIMEVNIDRDNILQSTLQLSCTPGSTRQSLYVVSHHCERVVDCK